uniref:Uncharacterized protein n=1 Tax=Peronospora matthiolae TaxID=2874970 RepID=A0AAV1VN98_9STRA
MTAPLRRNDSSNGKRNCCWVLMRWEAQLLLGLDAVIR